MKFTRRVFAVATAAFFVIGLGVGLSPGQADDSSPVIAGTFTLAVKVPSPGGDSLFAKPGSRTYYFGEGCAVGSACTIHRTTQSGDDATTPLTAGANGFSFRSQNPLDCFDNATGALSTKHGADYTFVGKLRPSAFEVRDGVRYATAMSGSYDEVVKINAAGRATNCTDNGKLVRKQHSVITGTMVPLALPGTGSDPAAGSGSTKPLGIDPATITAAGTVPAFRLPQSELQKESARAVAEGRRSSVPGALTAPADAVKNIGPRIGKDLLLVAALGLLMIFPAQLFNSTYEENHERIDRVLGRVRRRRPLPATAGSAIPLQRSETDEDREQPPDEDSAAEDPSSERPAAEEPTPEPVPAASPRRSTRLGVFLGCALVGTLLGGLLDPKLSLDTTWFALLVGVFVAVLVGVLLTALSGRTFRSATHRPHDWYLRAIPSALLVAVLCVAVSRLAHFEPGYLYGVLGGAVFAISLDRKSEGRAETAVFLGSIALAIVAWLAFGPVAKSANGADPSFGILTADAFLGSLFIGGVEGLLFGMIPLRFLPGYRIKGWSWVVWGLLTAVVLYTFVHVLLLPEAGYLGRSTAASVNLTLALFGAFGVASVLFWLWFRLRPDASAEEEPTEPEEQPAGAVTLEPAEPAEAREPVAAREPEAAMAGSPGDSPAAENTTTVTTEEARP